MIMEGLGVSKESFIELAREAVMDITLARNDMNRFLALIRRHSLCGPFGFSNLLYKLYKDYGLNLDTKNPDTCLRTAFVDTLINSSFSSIFKDIKYRCRIPVSKGWQLVGVADEGQAYINSKKCKEEDVFTLQEGEIYGKSSIENPEQINETYRYLLTLVCIQETPDSERIYLKGNCNISRSPVIYPGDGKPFQIT